ncbi:MAG: N-acetylmuramoyl-L-alanine amidase, partial [Verrucomicrobiota bacterium]|nr:N-acetylmuramoyl-L-alanine amidase [Verrucomicrobiota bacterium]
YGVMGLYAGQGFADQVGDAARLLRLPTESVKNNARLNILAAAALLDDRIKREIGSPGRDARGRIHPVRPEEISTVLMHYAGFSPSPVTSQVADYARASFAYDVLLAQDRGVDDRGIQVPQRTIEWDRAFDPEQLVTLHAPMVRLDATRDRIETPEYKVDPISETLVRKNELMRRTTYPSIQSTDYPSALWVPSPYYRSRSSYSSVSIHTAQGSYAGTISWFKSNPFSVSAHYVIRSSDGQITQMVRNYNAAQHIGIHNGTTLGVEHEGYVNNSSWYTAAMYNSSAALGRDFCARYSAISCANAYNGSSSSGVNVLSTSIDVKGHQHYSGQSHTDPGINWDWRRYYSLLNPGGGGGGYTSLMLDDFDSSVGHFNTFPTYSGSTEGISSASSATRDCTVSRHGPCSLRVLLKDDTTTSAHWWVRLLSGSGDPGSNVPLVRAEGRIGFWIYAGGSDMRVAVGIDDSDGTERALSKPLTPNTWTYVQWNLDDSSQWISWAGGNGAITASTVKLDAIWLFRERDTSYDINVYLDEVQIRH